MAHFMESSFFALSLVSLLSITIITCEVSCGVLSVPIDPGNIQLKQTCSKVKISDRMFESDMLGSRDYKFCISALRCATSL